MGFDTTLPPALVEIFESVPAGIKPAEAKEGAAVLVEILAAPAKPRRKRVAAGSGIAS